MRGTRAKALRISSEQQDLSSCSFCGAVPTSERYEGDPILAASGPGVFIPFGQRVAACAACADCFDQDDLAGFIRRVESPKQRCRRITPRLSRQAQCAAVLACFTAYAAVRR